jgi:hypothetical protein
MLDREPVENDTWLSPEDYDDPNHGLDGTETQKTILALATKHPGWPIDRVAAEIDTSSVYVASTLRRADDTLWTDVLVPWEQVEHIDDPDEQQTEYIRRLEAACKEAIP